MRKFLLAISVASLVGGCGASGVMHGGGRDTLELHQIASNLLFSWLSLIRSSLSCTLRL